MIRVLPGRLAFYVPNDKEQARLAEEIREKINQ